MRGVSRNSTCFRIDMSSILRIGPKTKPMNRSMPVHITPHMTWTQLRNQMFFEAIAATATTSAAATYQR